MKERIEELARECGIIGYEFINGKPVLEKISAREIRFFNEALEMAAKECEKLAVNTCILENGVRSEIIHKRAEICAQRIRKLKV